MGVMVKWRRRWTFLVMLLFAGAMAGCGKPGARDLAEGRRLLQEGQVKPAQAAFERVAQASGNDPDQLMRVVAAYVQAGKRTEALAWMDRIAKLKPSARQQIMLGTVYIQLGQTEKGCEEWRKVVEKSPKDGPTLNNYAYMCLVEPGKDLDRAISLLQRAVDLTGRRGFVVDSLGWAYYKRFQITRRPDDIQRAVELLEEAVVNSPKDAPLRYHLGEAYRLSGNPDFAFVELHKALALDPHLSEAQSALNALLKEARSERSTPGS